MAIVGGRGWQRLVDWLTEGARTTFRVAMSVDGAVMAPKKGRSSGRTAGKARSFAVRNLRLSARVWLGSAQVIRECRRGHLGLPGWSITRRRCARFSGACSPLATTPAIFGLAVVIR